MEDQTRLPRRSHVTLYIQENSDMPYEVVAHQSQVFGQDFHCRCRLPGGNENGRRYRGRWLCRIQSRYTKTNERRMPQGLDVHVAAIRLSRD